MLNPSPIPIQREEIFIERYDRLLAWSLQITERDPELAEDLLHDLFIQFTVNEPDLQKIGNLDGYLYAMLRNLHLAQRRRETRNTLQQLSIVEYDSAEIGLRTVDLRDQIQAQDDLRRVCHYACSRKETTKIAGVLILRFFHGYYPEEIVQLLRTPRPSIDNWLKLARHEARAELNDTGRLQFINRASLPEVASSGYARTLDAFLEELRQTIFQARCGDCLADADLKQRYLINNSIPLKCSELSHIVSCSDCLDRVNSLLGLPLLAERNATETLGRDTRKRGGGDGPGRTGGGLSKQRLNKLRCRVRDTLSHKPQELCVSVNGYTLGSQRISSERNELNLVVDRDERIGFVEVFSEQKIRLLMMGIEELPPYGPGQRTSHVELSDQRALDLTLRFASPSPTIQVVYSDPHFNEGVEVAAVDGSRDGTAALEDGESERGQAGLECGDGESGRHAEGQTRGHRDVSSFPTSPCFPVSASFPQPVSLASSFLRRFLDWRFWLRPQAVTAVFALFLLAALAYFNLRTHTSRPTAAALLSQSIAAEDALAARADLVLHRTFMLEEHGPNGKALARQRIEVWHSAANGITARRLYDEKGRLLSGEWARAGGEKRIFRNHHAAPQPQIDLQNSQAAIRSLEVWQLSPSAKDFIALIGTGDRASIEERNGSYVISRDHPALEASTRVNHTVLIKATLTLSRADLHASELTLLVQQPANLQSAIANREFVEYRLIESAFERRAPDTVAPSMFELDPELLVPGVEPERRDVRRETTPAATDPGAAAVVATAEVEVEVLRLLNEVGADMDDQTNVARTSEGKLYVSGIVETEGRRDEILRALAPIMSHPAVIVKIETVAEVVKRQKQWPSSSGPGSVQQVEVTKAQFPVEEEVRRYLGKQDGQGDEEVRQFAARVLNRSRLIMSEAGTLKRLAGQISAEDLRNMSAEARVKWLRIIRSHARSCEQETRKLRQELQPILSAGGAPSAGDDLMEINNDASLVRATSHVFDLVSANDRVLRSAFTISVQTSSTTAIKSPQFWGSLKNVESLAAKISRQ